MGQRSRRKDRVVIVIHESDRYGTTGYECTRASVRIGGRKYVVGKVHFVATSESISVNLSPLYGRW